MPGAVKGLTVPAMLDCAQTQMRKGFTRVETDLDDIKLDCPNAPKVICHQLPCALRVNEAITLLSTVDSELPDSFSNLDLQVATDGLLHPAEVAKAAI